MTMSLKDASTKSLIDELSNRTGIKVVSTGLYGEYDLRKKYDADRETVSAEMILIVDHLEA
ncbi:hypothetical protein QNH46_07705 [Paenibacillus woosongensis]|uniref:Uncharacterized protein n=1 Tax=Paenibacillus woosongensis TaxID=307580 RepID=A0AA95ICC8_9BACL|nr:hypothetical protein [Paenibacillus woosongensis]WHX50522.1 hypothetical protein QNH46_07705 [Paenibacillus woosongensis]